ncbi:MAG: UPF0262 family protein [Pseudomonadota bacterium]
MLPDPVTDGSKTDGAAAKSPDRLVDVVIDDVSIGRSGPAIDHERQVAVHDLLEDNAFALVGHARGPYSLTLAVVERRLVFDVRTAEGREPVAAHMLALSPLRRAVKDYHLICDSYYEAIKTASPSQIEAIDMGRRGLHNDGSTLLMERLDGKISIDFETARRLFTLICVLHWKG